MTPEQAVRLLSVADWPPKLEHWPPKAKHTWQPGMTLVGRIEAIMTLPRPDGSVLDLAANVEPYVRADGVRVWSLMPLERQLRPEAFARRRGGYLDRRRVRTVDP